MRSRAADLWGEPAVRFGAIAAVLVLAAAALVAAFGVPGSEPAPTLLERPVTVKRALSTTAALFGDPIEAELAVYSEDASVDPGSVRVATDFRPYRAVSTRVERESVGGVSLLRTRIRLQCLVKACLPPRGAGRSFDFRPATVTFRQGTEDVRLPVEWTPLQVWSRLPADPSLRARIVDAAPELDAAFDRSPDAWRVGLAIAAVLLGLAGAALLVVALWPAFPYSLRRWRRLSPLEQSLLQVEAAAGIDDERVRRQTLDRLANRLAEVPSPALELETRALAWGAEPPEPDDLTAFAAHVRVRVNGKARA